MRAVLALIALLSLAVSPAVAQQPDWEETLSKAKGQQVFWNAWGGDERINAYIAWVGERVRDEHGVTLRHVKLADTAEAVSRVLAEKTAGQDEGGTVDLIWINGENFATMLLGRLEFFTVLILLAPAFWRG